MKQKDDIELLFERLEGSFDVNETPDHHKKRFLAKLEANDTSTSNSKKAFNWWKPLSIAATIALLISAGFFFQENTTPEVEGLASVSPEM
ncbi:MAG: hypothetical protein K0U54_02760, partial [Bacteroidetes bacterium]|nr:hypothetical protein [Bacteroidota bacterium]